jgi:hypothetical protein
MLHVLGILTNVMSGLGFEKPFIPIYISSLNHFIFIPIGIWLPGLWEWFEMVTMVLIPLGLGYQYFWNGLRHGKDAS